MVGMFFTVVALGRGGRRYRWSGLQFLFRYSCLFRLGILGEEWLFFFLRRFGGGFLGLVQAILCYLGKLILGKVVFELQGDSRRETVFSSIFQGLTRQDFFRIVYFYRFRLGFIIDKYGVRGVRGRNRERIQIRRRALQCERGRFYLRDFSLARECVFRLVVTQYRRGLGCTGSFVLGQMLDGVFT